MSGSRTSSRTMSGRSRLAADTAVPPSGASPTTSYPSASSIRRALARKLGWSSTISTVLLMRPILRRCARSGPYGCPHPRVGVPVSPQARSRTPGRLQAPWFDGAATASVMSTFLRADRGVVTMTTEPHVSSQASRTEHDRALAENPTYVDSYSAVTQLSRRQVLAAWAATAAPLGVLLWVVAPWLSHRLDSRDPFIEALLLCFAVGLVWQVSLALILVRREQGALRWPQLRDGLWLRAPKNPRTGRRGGKTWWWVVP